METTKLTPANLGFHIRDALIELVTKKVQEKNLPPEKVADFAQEVIEAVAHESSDDNGMDITEIVEEHFMENGHN